ncbi:2-succinyl-6-hydroxy-2,4-cyclohexadiene-1-carboxylate synthase [Carboxydochorda subterranea]|uniref:Putative 2-succinyl-6-hydroxy-2,4-cyclohexadiene-1-carboxylate synthase n=1 Tax=Carboxydichorda subterranea TaxID=3109565 RepID=A0ABZ1BZE2_9FIRM|nr:2-succinyl-6-hydroxy-2,4-cyclohexadiene-1-carboxylate synthase [Limnochorda sp. L945t]WRP17458.1 2-succinyl-6-hydroxy-2,4-cyclohexadiene-1-carboxylate synthase [Limnochorda sp. L945t]
MTFRPQGAPGVRIAVNGLHLYVEASGPGPGTEPHDRTRPPLLLIHGFTGSTRTWQAHLGPLGQARGLAYAVDLVGHGRSDAPGEPSRYGFARVVEDLLGLMDRLEARVVDLLGYSMGGRVAMHLALAAPGRVRSLVVESASPGIEDPEERARRRAQDEELALLLEREGIRAFVERWESQPLFATQAALDPAVRDAVRADRLSQRPHGLAFALRGLGAGVQQPLWNALGGLRLPVLVLAGEKDARYRHLARRMGALVPGARVAVVEGAGHAVHLERPEAFRSLVLEFLAGVDAR